MTIPPFTHACPMGSGLTGFLRYIVYSLWLDCQVVFYDLGHMIDLVVVVQRVGLILRIIIN